MYFIYDQLSNSIAVNARPNAFNKENGVILIRATNGARAMRARFC